MIVQFILQFFIPADNIPSAMIILFNPSKSIREAAICIPVGSGLTRNRSISDLFTICAIFQEP